MYKSFNTFLFRTPYYPFSALPDFEIKQHKSVFKEMLQIATPDLSKGLAKSEDRIRYSTYHYYQRACTRPTPFGLFSECSVGVIGEQINSFIGTEEMQTQHAVEHELHVRVDTTDKSIRDQLCYYLNRSNVNLIIINNFSNTKAMKAYKYIFITSALLVILGTIMNMLHVNIGISGKSLGILALMFLSAYQSWLIAKLYKQLKDKEKKDSI